MVFEPQVISLDSPIEIRQAAAVNFKNFVKQRWVRNADAVELLSNTTLAMCVCEAQGFAPYIQAPPTDGDTPAISDQEKARPARVCMHDQAPFRVPCHPPGIPITTEQSADAGHRTGSQCSHTISAQPVQRCHTLPHTCAVRHAPEQGQIKAALPGLMLSTPPLARAQLSEALSVISGHDFPARWPELLPELIRRLGSGTPAEVAGVLETANSIYKRYRNAFMSDALSRELAYSQQLVEPLLACLKVQLHLCTSFPS